MSLDTTKLQQWPNMAALETAAASIKAKAKDLLGHAQDVEADYVAMRGHYETNKTEEFLRAMDVPQEQMSCMESMSNKLAVSMENFAESVRALEPDRSQCLRDAAELTRFETDVEVGQSVGTLRRLEHLAEEKAEKQSEIDRVARRFEEAVQTFEDDMRRITYTGPTNNIGSSDPNRRRSDLFSLAEQLEGTTVTSLGDSTVSAETLAPYDPLTNYAQTILIYETPEGTKELTLGEVLAMGVPAGWSLLKTEYRRNLCHRSNIGGGTQLADLLGMDSQNFACSGATTFDLLKANHQGNYGEGAQILQAFPEKTYDEGIVYLRIGANDALFGPVMSDMVMNSDGTTTPNAKASQKAINGDLQTQIADSIAEIKKRAPNKTIVIVGYPKMFAQPNPASTAGMTPQDFITIDNFPSDTPHVNPIYDPRGKHATTASTLGEVSVIEQKYMNQQAVAANNKIKQTADNIGVIYVDPNSAYEGHRFGDPHPYINPLTWDLDPLNHEGLTPISTGSFHYTQAGYGAEAMAAEDALEDR